MTEPENNNSLAETLVSIAASLACGIAFSGILGQSHYITWLSVIGGIWGLCLFPIARKAGNTHAMNCSLLSIIAWGIAMIHILRFGPS